MAINPMNVINLLLVVFQGLQLEKTLVTREEIALKNSIGKILLDTMPEFNEIEITEEETLHFQEPYRDIQLEIVEHSDKLWASDEYENSEVCTKMYKR